MAWPDFLQQFEAEGRDKGDGYFPAQFDGLTPAELVRARAMMLGRALAGDSADLSGLAYVGDAGVIAALDVAAGRPPFDRWDLDIGRLDTLYALIGDDRNLRALLAHLDSRDGERQARAANALAWHVLPPHAEPALVDRIADGRHEAALNGLLAAWLALHERRCDPMSFGRHIELVRRVSRMWPCWRRRALLAATAPGIGPGAG